MSRDKGKRGEREAATLLSNLLGATFKRGVQHSGGPNSPDIKAEIKTTLHPEVKRDESTLSLKSYTALEQARRDAGNKKTPFVVSRRNNKKWVFLIEEDNLIDFCKEVIRLYDK